MPAEHGGWALIIEPVVLGLLVAPSLAGLFIGAASLACFLARHPLKLAVGDRLKKRVLKRTSLADRFASLYLTLAIVFFAIAFATAAHKFILPLIVAAPFVLIQLVYDAKGQGRRLTPEVTGALAVGSISTAIALAAGWPKLVAFALWVIVACRHVPTILYLRVLLSRRRQRQRASVDAAAIAIQFVPLIAVYVLLSLKSAPVTAIFVFVILFIRAVILLLNHTTPAPKKLGISELVFGTFAILMLGAGYRFGW